MSNSSTTGSTQPKQDKEKIEDILNRLVPTTQIRSGNALRENIHSNSGQLLKNYRMYRLGRLLINDEVDDLRQHLQVRIRTFLAAAHSSGDSVVIAYRGRDGKIDVLVGMHDESTTDQERVLTGVLPGAHLTEVGSMCEMVGDHAYKGIASGIPVLPTEKDEHRFDITNVVRSLDTTDFNLVLHARPLNQADALGQLDQLHQLRREAAKQASRSKTKEEGRQFSSSETNSTTNSVSIGGGIPAVGGIVGGSYSFSKTSGQTRTEGESVSESITEDQIDPVAQFLEQVAEEYSERVRRGLNVGYWDTSISFTAESRAGCECLAGSLKGSFSAPDDQSLPLQVSVLSDKNRDDGSSGPLLIPSTSDESPGPFPTALSSCITSREVALAMPLPSEPLPGYDIVRRPELSLSHKSRRPVDVNDTEEDTTSTHIGQIVDHHRVLKSSTVTLQAEDLTRHTFVCGVTGSGKTTTIKGLLEDLSDIPYLVVESAKREYRSLFGKEENLRVYTIGDPNTSPLPINPLYVPEGVPLQFHIDLLKSLFNACFGLYGPMPFVLEQCLYETYERKGWNTETGNHPFLSDDQASRDEPSHRHIFPTLTDLENEVRRHLEASDYEGELRSNIRAALITRLQSLSTGGKGAMFNTYAFPSLDDLFGKKTVLELEPLADDDDKAFFLGLLLILLNEYRKSSVNSGHSSRRSNESGPELEHVLVLEEAHRLLKNVSTERSSEMLGNARGKAVEAFCNVIAEMRSLGQGVIISEQIPNKIAPDVIKNTNTKIVHRLVSPDDQRLMAGAISLEENQASYMNQLRPGEALFHTEGNQKPVQVEVTEPEPRAFFTNEVLQREMASRGNPVKTAARSAQSLKSSLGREGMKWPIRLLNSILAAPDLEDTKPSLKNAREGIAQVIQSKNVSVPARVNPVDWYLAHRLTELLVRGLYALGFDGRKEIRSVSGDALVEILARSVREESMQTIDKIRECFAQQDDVEDSRESASIRVFQLAVEAIEKGLSSVSTNQERVRLVQSYFIDIDVEFATGIAVDIGNRQA